MLQAPPQHCLDLSVLKLLLFNGFTSSSLASTCLARSSVGRLHGADRVHCLHHVHLVGHPLGPQWAAQHLPEALAEVLGDESIDDGVEAGVCVGHQVGDDAQDVGGVVEREVSEPHAQHHQVVGEPAEAEKNSHDDDHLGDLLLGSSGLGHVLHRVDGGPQVADGAGIGEAQHQHRDQVAKDKGADVHYNAWSGLPGGDTQHSASQFHLGVVAEVRSREDQGQGPHQAQGPEGVLWCPQLPGAQRVADG